MAWPTYTTAAQTPNLPAGEGKGKFVWSTRRFGGNCRHANGQSEVGCAIASGERRHWCLQARAFPRAAASRISAGLKACGKSASRSITMISCGRKPRGRSIGIPRAGRLGRFWRGASQRYPRGHRGARAGRQGRGPCHAEHRRASTPRPELPAQRLVELHQAPTASSNARPAGSSQTPRRTSSISARRAARRFASAADT